MKEFLKNKWYIILGLILLIASVVVSVILYIKLDECTNKKCDECETCEEVKCEEKEEIKPEEDDEENQQLPSEDETYSFISIVKADEFGVSYDYNESTNTPNIYKALKNGYLVGEWYIEELKDTKFIGTAGVNMDVGPATIFALAENGELYRIYNDDDRLDYHKLNTSISGKLIKMENMLLIPKNHKDPFYFIIKHQIII